MARAFLGRAMSPKGLPRTLWAALLCATAMPAAAQDDSSGFVEANLIGIFYHELGHAVIHIEGVPIFGQEEDAADVFSIFLIDALFEPDSAEVLAYDAALGFWAEAELRAAWDDEIPWWSEHGPDEQRFFNTVCLFYGADPEARAFFAEDMGLPEDRAQVCPEEYDQANASWGAVLDDMIARGPGDSLVMEGADGSLSAQVLAEEIAVLNDLFSLPQTLPVVLESCGEANAFYDRDEQIIIMCTEFEDHLRLLEEHL